jgi:DivIVA domain-containing protein
MADELTPGQIRSRRFDVVRRGYDRQQVEQFLDGVADDLDRLSRAASDLGQGDVAIGVEDPEALARELHSIGTDVAAVLEAARSAAEGMRVRASGDAETWRSKAETTSEKMVDAATEQSQSMRAAAWNQGSSLLSSAVAESGSLVAEAKEDSLFVRAEAEREALRLTGDAKRDREEKIRAARLEAEQVLESARTESSGVLSAATQQAELAQERARALEDRRSELLAELEGARASIGQLESEIESRRQELAPEPEEEVPIDELSHHGVDSGSVRIVAPSRAVTLEPVDPDEFIAEVEALRSGTSLTAVSVPEPEPEPDPEPEVETVLVATPESTEPIQDETPAVEAPPVQAAPATKPASPGDEIGSLFASLRDDALETESTPPSTPPTKKATVTEDQATPQPEPPLSNESTLIPVQNTALRVIKRSLVDLQNETLEHLRNDDTWMPDRGFTDRFGPPFAEMAYVLTGSGDAAMGTAFGADLHDAVSAAIDRTRGAGAGEREVASSASKVFRTWRSDDAERRVVAAAQELSAQS